MIRGIKSISGFKIHAVDGDIGKVHEFFFDDKSWEIRYLVVDTSIWVPGRKVLVSPVALYQPDWEEQKLPVRLNKEQIESSPDIDTDKPVSRQRQIELHTHYRWPPYWPVGGFYDVPPPPLPVYILAQAIYHRNVLLYSYKKKRE